MSSSVGFVSVEMVRTSFLSGHSVTACIWFHLIANYFDKQVTWLLQCKMKVVTFN